MSVRRIVSIFIYGDLYSLSFSACLYNFFLFNSYNDIFSHYITQPQVKIESRAWLRLKALLNDFLPCTCGVYKELLIYANLKFPYAWRSRFLKLGILMAVWSENNSWIKTFKSLNQWTDWRMDLLLDGSTDRHVHATRKDKRLFFKWQKRFTTWGKFFFSNPYIIQTLLFFSSKSILFLTLHFPASFPSISLYNPNPGVDQTSMISLPQSFLISNPYFV